MNPLPAFAGKGFILNGIFISPFKHNLISYSQIKQPR